MTLTDHAHPVPLSPKPPQLRFDPRLQRSGRNPPSGPGQAVGRGRGHALVAGVAGGLPAEGGEAGWVGGVTLCYLGKAGCCSRSPSHPTSESSDRKRREQDDETANRDRGTRRERVRGSVPGGGCHQPGKFRGRSPVEPRRSLGPLLRNRFHRGNREAPAITVSFAPAH